MQQDTSTVQEQIILCVCEIKSPSLYMQRALSTLCSPTDYKAVSKVPSVECTVSWSMTLCGLQSSLKYLCTLHWKGVKEKEILLFGVVHLIHHFDHPKAAEAAESVCVADLAHQASDLAPTSAVDSASCYSDQHHEHAPSSRWESSLQSSLSVVTF